MKKGIFCISLDTEFLWGRHDKAWQDFVWRAKKTRTVIKKLLELFDKYDILATWAVVGKLYEKPPKKKKYANLWYAPDIIQLIKAHKNQEIGCHSYSHPEFDKLTKTQAEEEIKKCPKSTSFVFPRNKIKHLDILKKYDYKCYRGYDHQDSKAIELTRLISGIPHITEPYKNNGLINIPATFYYVSTRGYRRYIPNWFKARTAKVGIKKAINEHKVFHLWGHPIDFADGTKKMFDGLEKILLFADEKRKEGKLEIKTMGTIASEF